MTIKRSLRARLFALGLAPWVLASGCATMGAARPAASLRVTSNVADATVWIDDRLVAPVSAFVKAGQRLPVGFHRIEIRAPGYYSHFQEIDAAPDTSIVVQAPLHPLLD